jgi:protein-disulfide isomerase
MQPLDDAVDHVRGPMTAPVLIEYGDYECPYSRRAYREIQRVESQIAVRFAFRQFPLMEIHPHAASAAAAAEAAGVQGRFWDMHDVLFHHQAALEDDDLRHYASELELDVAHFEADCVSDSVLRRVARDINSGLATHDVQGTPTLFIDGVVHQGTYDADALLEALAR